MKIILSISMFFYALMSFAQQDALSTLFWQNLAHFNPAISGLEHSHFASLSYRNQWDKVNGAPVSVFANYGTRLWKNHGIGAVYSYDQLGFSKSNNALINYNYQLRLKEGHTLSMGVAGGIMNLQMTPFWIPPSQNPDNTLPANFSATEFDANAGVAYSNKNLLVGFGVAHINAPILRPNNSGLIINYNVARHAYLNSAYKIQIGEKVMLKPQLLIRTDFVAISSDINLLATLKNKYWLGVSYRSSDAIAGMIGWDIKERYRIGYAYDFTINKLSNISQGSHEATLAFLLN